jgi:CubicO group peptidase (beta-lactamase class C family)
MSMVAIRILASALCLAVSSITAFADDPLPRAKPEEVGLSSERLARIGETLKADIDAGRIPGAVIAIARRGKLVALDAYGWRDKAANVPMTTDTIFNIASMTKPMTAVGALMMVERGKLLIDDPLAKYFPKFADMRVAVRDAGEPTAETVPANRKITIQDLMRHTSGIIYGGRGTTLVHKQYPGGSGDASRDYDGAAFMDKLGVAAVAVSTRHGLGLRLWARRARAYHRADQQAVARAISAGQSVDAARHDRHRVLDFTRQGRALREAVAGRSRHRKGASPQP